MQCFCSLGIMVRQVGYKRTSIVFYGCPINVNAIYKMPDEHKSTGLGTVLGAPEGLP